MNWFYGYHLLLAISFVHYACALQGPALTVETGLSDKPPTEEVPRPIEPYLFEELDAAYNRPRKLTIKVWKTAKSNKPSIVDIALQIAAKEGLDAMTNLYQNIEPEIARKGQLLEDNHPAALLSRFSAPVEGTERSAMAAYATITATKAFRRNYKESTVLGRQAQAQKLSFRRTPLEGLCPPRESPICTPASQRYRTHDGTCNNRRRPRWGSAQMPFNRFLPPEYGDGVDSIRGSVEGGPLSSARFVSLLVHGAREGDAPLTLMIVQWGQLLDHDLTSTAQPRSINGSVPSCCGSKDFHPSCFPIKVPLDDPWLAPLKVRCLEFLRSAPAQRRDCVLSWREQTNQVTSYIDASPIYSSNAKTSDIARIFRNGLLVYGRGNAANDVCMRGAFAHQCIRSGDGRSGEQPGLLALHHVWVGEHNRIALELSTLNPHWSDEKVYQEARRIIGALFQHITYREFLPIVLGREVCKLFNLELLNSGYYTGYDPNTNPTVSNSFAAAAFRFGHSLVQNTYLRCDRHHNFIGNNVTLHEEFQHGDIGTAGSLHRLLRGLAAQKALKRDEFITPELTNHLFQTPGFPFGLDLAAINIQRGRDHGIAPYTAWRQPCGLSAINSWDDLSNVVGPESAKRISHAYRNVHDIDLFVGGIAERPVIGGLVGPTFACIIAQQFSNSRKGDRFWYENTGFESSFTPAQLHSLRHVSFASVLCRAIGGTLQPHVFIPSDIAGNQRVECGIDPLAPIDLRPWKEQDPFLENTEKVSSPISHDPVLPTPLPLQSAKEQKGVNNRIHNITTVTHIDFIPNGSIGFHRVPNMTKIHDKLDMAQKVVARPFQKPLEGISNKLDKGRLPTKKRTKPTASLLSKRLNSTTRRTVVIHNVEIELRSSPPKANKKKKKKTNRDSPKNSNAANVSVKVTGALRSPFSSAIQAIDDGEEGSEEISTQASETNILGYTTTDAQVDTPTELIDSPTEPTTIQSAKKSKPTSDLFVFDMDFPSTLRTPSTDRSNQSYQDFQAVIDSALHDANDQHIRVHRSPFNRHIQVRKVELSTHLDFFDKLRTLKFDKSDALFGRELSDPVSDFPLESTQNSTNFSVNVNATATDNEDPTDQLDSLRNIDLRQSYEKPIYNRPQKLIVDGPNADQYEIEINIRHTKPNSNAIYPSTKNPIQRYDPDAYVENFQDPHYRPQAQNTAYYPPTTIAPYVIRTKPPTVIYLDEHDDLPTTTTHAPSFFQNILSMATNSFIGNKPPTSGLFNHVPNRFSTGGLSNDIPYQSSSSKYPSSTPLKPTSNNHLSAQQAYPYPPPQQNFPPPQQNFPPPQQNFPPPQPNFPPPQPNFPPPPPVGPVSGYHPPNVARPPLPYPPPDHSGANSFSMASNLGGISHASSSAVSTGHFGSIVGSAHSTGSDSTFSFNIRPSSRPQPNVVVPTDIRPNYELIPSHRPQYQSTPSYAVPPKPITSVESFHYPPNRQDPFSGYNRRPQYSNKRPLNVYDPAYDDLGRSELKPDNLNVKTNESKHDNDDLDNSDYDYNDDDDESNINNDVDYDEPAKTFDKDGYLRPEYMTTGLYQQTLLNKITLNATDLDDNFVLPVLQQDDTFVKVQLTDINRLNVTTNLTTFPEIEQKSLTNDIMAEDYDDLLTANMSLLNARTSSRGQKRKRPTINLQVAFAPIKVLTKPERPDNWLIFDTLEEKPLLPVLPAYNTETQPAAEVPLPIDEHRMAAPAELTYNHNDDLKGPTSSDLTDDGHDIVTERQDSQTVTETTNDLDVTTLWFGLMTNVTEDITNEPTEDVTDRHSDDQRNNETTTIQISDQTDSTTKEFTDRHTQDDNLL